MMTYAGLQMLMEKLKQLIHCNDIPSINHPAIIRERPQFQLLYDELDNPMIQTLFIDQHQDLEKVNDLKKRFTDAAEEAQYIVDLFLSGVHVRKNGRRSCKSVLVLFLYCFHIRNDGHFPTSLDLDDVRRSLESVKVEFMSMKLDSSRRPERTLDQSAAAHISISRRSKKSMDEIFVGLDDDLELIRSKLVEDQRKVDIVSIVGVGGIGKTTLATKVFNDAYVKHHFHVLVWVTVSETYNKQDVLIQIVESIRGQLHLQKDNNESRLREMVHKNLMGRRYLIVIDDIWHTETWDSLKLFFPHDNTRSRILLTSRLIEVAKHANSAGFIHHLACWSKEKSWDLLCQKVFRGNECPEWSIKHGMEIVENCKGLPLAVAVIAGVLAKEAQSEKFWVEIAERTGSYIVGDENGCMETLALSYNHLPLHLKECFLYLGGFREDYNYQVRRLIRLWVAEGFIEQDGNRSFEDIAEGYLMDLIDRNLIIVAQRKKSNGAVKAFKVHDLVRELCLRKAKEEGFILQTENSWKKDSSSQLSKINISPYTSCRLFIDKDMLDADLAHPHSGKFRSILCFTYYNFHRHDIAKYFRSFVLLRVLDLQDWLLYDFPKDMELLVHLRYLSFCHDSLGFPSSICKLWNLQTLIYFSASNRVALPSNISDLVNLRHLWSSRPIFFPPSIKKPMNLQTITEVQLGDNFQKCFPHIKKLTCTTNSEKEYDFKSLTFLEKLEIRGRFSTFGVRLLRRMKTTVLDGPKGCGKNRITFPATLKTLALYNSKLPWSDMSIIQSLPNLQVLRLHGKAFVGSCSWNTEGQEFPQLKFLRLKALDIKQWEAYSTSFPCLRQLEVIYCKVLEEIPLEIGEIPTLELIKIDGCRPSLEESARRIEEEQQNLGNYDLKIEISKPQWMNYV